MKTNLTLSAVALMCCAFAGAQTPIVSEVYVAIATSTANNAGTDGDVYLGLGGREFHLDTDRDNFERGRLDIFILGDTHGYDVSWATVLHPERNDPRNPATTIADVNANPVYVRFKPRKRPTQYPPPAIPLPVSYDCWKLDKMQVIVYSNVLQQIPKFSYSLVGKLSNDVYGEEPLPTWFGVPQNRLQLDLKADK